MTWQCALCEATSAGTQVKRAGPKSLICSWCAGELAKRGRGFCRKCKSSQPLPFGTAHKGAWCRACDKAYMQAKYERNRDARLSYQRAYHEAHREAQAERNRRYRIIHQGAINARKRRMHAAHPERKHAIDQRWRERHPEQVRAISRSWREQNGERIRLYRVRRKLQILRGLR